MRIYKIICPDGADRLKANWEDLRNAEFDALYFSMRRSCSDWCDKEINEKLGICKGGIHTINHIKIEEQELLTNWVTDLS